MRVFSERFEITATGSAPSDGVFLVMPSLDGSRFIAHEVNGTKPSREFWYQTYTDQVSLNDFIPSSVDRNVRFLLFRTHLDESPSLL